MMGTAGLKGLRVDCVVGIYEHERRARQPVQFDVELDYDFAAAAKSDAIGDAVNYEAVATVVTTLVSGRDYQLIETMAEDLARALFDKLPAVHTVRLEIRKPAAVAAAQCSFVRVERRRS